MKIFAPAAALLLVGTAHATPRLGPAYGDHMVLQSDQPVLIIGTAAAQTSVTGTLAGSSATAKADKLGSFTLRFPALKAGSAPLTLRVADRQGAVQVTDILVGDVWLCSGQSNMEFPLARSLQSDAAFRRGPDPMLRLLAIPKATASTPKASFGEAVAWRIADGESTRNFSAACYFMGSRLRTDKNVPVGLIHASWGGSQARAWLSPLAAEALYGNDSMALLALQDRDPLAAVERFAPTWMNWWTVKDGGREPWLHPEALDWKPVPKISFWNDWVGSGLDKNAIANVWLTREFNLNAEQAAAGGVVHLGALDDMDMTFINGHPVGYTFGWGLERQYAIPARYLKPGRNRVLLAVNNSYDTGGFFQGGDRLYFETAGSSPIPLGSDWRYAVAPFSDVPPRSPWDSIAGLGVMHNRMIAPIGPMRLAGVAWYQGESDTETPGYADRLRLLFAGWRAQFGEAAKMLVAQLPNYGQRTAKPVASGWASLRNDQVRAVRADPNAALVTILDVGDATDLHPSNKPVVGARLGLAAEGKAMPMPLAARIAAGDIIVSFTGIEGGLRAYSGREPLGFELCGATQESCRYAVQATIKGDAVTIPLDGQPALRLRYAWADAPIINLYDGRGLPIPGFELPISP